MCVCVFCIYLIFDKNDVFSDPSDKMRNNLDLLPSDIYIRLKRILFKLPFSFGGVCRKSRDILYFSVLE